MARHDPETMDQTIAQLLQGRRLSALFTFLGIVAAAPTASGEASPASPPANAVAPPADSSPVQATVSAAPPTVKECLAAHHESQSLRRQFQLLESRDVLNECSNATCPAPVRRDCLRWLEEVSLQLPSVVFRLDESETSRNIKIYVDDKLRFPTLPNRAIEFNPGTYHFRFVIDGKPPIEQEIVLGEAEKFRSVNIRFASGVSGQHAAASATPPAPKTAASTREQHAISASRPVPLATYVFAGIGAAAAVSFAAWGLASTTLKSDLQKDCAPDCTQDQIDRVRSRALIADISLAASVASLGTAAVFYFFRPTLTRPVEFDVGLGPKGGIMGSVRVTAF